MSADVRRVSCIAGGGKSLAIRCMLLLLKAGIDTTPISLHVGLECGHLAIEIIAKAIRQISLPLLALSVPDRDVSTGKGAGGRVIRLTWTGSVIEW